jgi:hypothetical protein
MQGYVLFGTNIGRTALLRSMPCGLPVVFWAPLHKLPDLPSRVHLRWQRIHLHSSFDLAGRNFGLALQLLQLRSAILLVLDLNQF